MTPAERPAHEGPAGDQSPGAGDWLDDHRTAVVRCMKQPVPSPVTTTVRAFMAERGPVPGTVPEIAGWLRDIIDIAAMVSRRFPLGDTLDVMYDTLDAAEMAVARLVELTEIDR